MMPSEAEASCGEGLVVLDGNEVGILGTAKGTPERAAAEEIPAGFKAAEASCGWYAAKNHQDFWPR